jgi:hypothetical protein
MIKTLAIIGTAGRKEDSKKLTLRHWDRMCDAAEKVIKLENITHLVSGGAAWADHVAIEVGLDLEIPTTIWLPEKEKDLEIASYYHKAFGKIIGGDTWDTVMLASAYDNFTLKNFGGFKDRNTKVAEQADVFLAMTFGDREKVKDGGTADTVVKMQSRGIKGYHLDLNALKMYKI